MTSHFITEVQLFNFISLSLSPLINDIVEGRLLYQRSFSVPSGEAEEKKERKTLASSLACLVGETSRVQQNKPKSRVELKRFFHQRIKRRVKERYVDGKFKCLLQKVVANPETLKDAYDCIRVDSNVDPLSDPENSPFESIADELLSGTFDVSANTYSISTRGPTKEVLVFPNHRLKVVQEATRIVLEVVFQPYFSKISHGGRNGRDHLSALRYIKKEIPNPKWWFSLVLNKKVDDCILNKILSVISNKVEDSELNAMLTSMYDARVLNLEFGSFPKGHGFPQEGVLSPILMNIYLDLFDSEMYRIAMKYEALDMGLPAENNKGQSNLRTWFRRQMNINSLQGRCVEESTSTRLHCCRFMDEIFIAVSGSKEIALACKSDIEDYLKSFLHIEVSNQTDILPCDGVHGVQFLGAFIQRGLKDGPAVRAVHKLKDKVRLFASQKQEAWEAGTLRIGKKWLAHGLKKVKESEIKHLSGNNPMLNQISNFRKSGMKTDHWYKVLLKVWMQDINAVSAGSEEVVLSKHIAEPALPQELRDSFNEFQKRAKEYVSSETSSIIALLPSDNSSSTSFTKILAPTNAIKTRLQRYGLTNAQGFPRTCHMLILLDDDQIIDWFSGIIHRWLRWYDMCDNFNDVKLLISDQVRMSCIRTLAAKYRIHEIEIEKKFDQQLSNIPSVFEGEQNINCEDPNNDVNMFYGISYSGLCFLSFARVVSQSRPCSCFVMGCVSAAPCVYTLHVMERKKFPGWKTGFSSFIHPSLHRRKIGLCKQHLKDLFLGHISLQSINFGAWR